ncbi:MAG: amidohydrolase [Fluviicola sp.]|nr:MAG: amidohydrolase [Fluviicola sp.]
MSHHHDEGLSCACCSPLWKNFLKDSLNVKNLTTKTTKETPEDVIFHTANGGTIQTLEGGENVEVEAIGIKDGKIHVTGSLSHVENEMDGCENKLEISGSQIMLPGLIEPHVHLGITAATNNYTDVGPFDGQYLKKVYTKESVATNLKGSTRIPGRIEGKDVNCFIEVEWYIGQQMDPSLLQGDKEFNAEFLNDQVSNEHPVFLLSGSLHTAYINKVAIELLNDNGYDGPELDPSGVLQELEQLIPVIEYLPVPNTQEILTELYKIFDTAVERGVTYMLDAALFPDQIKYFEELANVEDLDVRIGAAIISKSLVGFKEDIVDNFYPNTGNEKFNLAYLKLVSDGSNQGLTGYQTAPYCCNEDYIKDPAETNTGIFNFGDEEFNGLLETAKTNGWPVMMHANGDKAIERTIAGFRAAGVTNATINDRRDRIEHCSLLTDKDIEGMEELGISPSFLIGHVGYWGWMFQNTILGEARSNHLDRCKSALDHNMRITLHSDLGVSPLGPLRMMEQSMTRLMEGAPEEKKPVVLNSEETITAFQALKAATYDAAWQCHADQWVGSLEKGKCADFVILEQSPLTYKNEDSAYPAEGMRNIPVIATWKGGRCVFPKNPE